MKRVNTSLTKTGIIFSLVLLSPGVMAAENLNFNYTRAGTISLEPRFGLQVRGCHSLTDPVTINVKLKDLSTKNLAISLALNGETVRTSYAVFSSSVVKASATNTDFQVPFAVSVRGNVIGIKTTTVPAPLNKSKGYCFADGAGDFSAGGDEMFAGYSPMKLGGVNAASHCVSANGLFWPDGKNGYPNWPPEKRWFTPYAPGGLNDYYTHYLNNMTHKTKAEWLVTHYFYSEPASPESSEEKIEKNYNSVNLNIPGLGYNIPVHGESALSRSGVNYDDVHLNEGSFLFTVSNRNITSMELDIRDINSGKVSRFKWLRNTNNEVLANDLVYQNGVNDLLITSPGQIDSTVLADPYKSNYFYREGVSAGLFRGTLVTEGMLTSGYADYIKTVPLSKPAQSRGAINLVNSDSITMNISQKSKDSGGGYTLSIYGQPIKFAPAYFGKSQVLTASQVRNACY
ncbi:hypothetical protein CSM81_22780 [Salmonella enterica subsp. enterica serovar Infantis]|nr:hypothetical protein [Salmonella enterica subsp. enterica serovar Infantis]